MSDCSAHDRVDDGNRTVHDPDLRFLLQGHTFDRRWVGNDGQGIEDQIAMDHHTGKIDRLSLLHRRQYLRGINRTGLTIGFGTACVQMNLEEVLSTSPMLLNETIGRSKSSPWPTEDQQSNQYSKEGTIRHEGPYTECLSPRQDSKDPSTLRRLM